MSLFFIAPPRSVAQKNFTFRHFDETQGLSSNFVESVSQSRTGHLIVAGKNGLDRFDGRAFIKLKSDTTPLDHVTSLNFSDKDISFGLFNGNIGTLSETGKITQIETGINSQVKHIYKDEKDGIWAFSRTGMVFWLNGTDTIRYDLTGADMLVNAVIPYKYKEFMIGSNEGLVLVRFEETGTFQILEWIDELPQAKITAMKYELGSDVLWVGTEDEGLYRVFSPFSKQQYIKELLLSDGTSVNNAQAIYADDLGRIWLGTFGNGLLRIEFYGEEKKKFITQQFTKNVDQQYLIRDIFQDAEKNIWLATFGGGLIQIIENIFHQPFDQKWLRKQSITRLFRDSKGNVWLGIDKGIFKTSEHGMQSNFEYHNIGGNEVTAITEDAQGRIWAGTNNAGLYVLNTSKNVFEHLILNKGKLANSINSITPSETGVCVSTKFGLFQLSSQGQIIKHLSTIDGLPHNNIKFSFTDSIGRIWIANEANRVCYFWQNEIRFIESKSAQHIFGVNHILQDYDGRLWFATLGRGIFVLDNGTAHNVNQTNGLPSNYCYRMVLDNGGNVWTSHQKSISQIAPDLSIAHIIGRADITPVENSMISFLFKDKEGSIWISFTHGVVKFNPTVDRTSKTIPQLSIAAMQVLKKDQPMIENLILPYKKYSVQFELAGISLRDPDKIRYKYQLKGLSDTWFSLSSNLVEIPRLEEGHYQLNVIASKNGGEWTPEPASYSFSIARPFYLNWGFWVLIGLILVALIVFFVQYRTYRLKADKADLEAIVKERTNEIEEQKTEIERSRDQATKYAKDITDSIRYAKRIQKAIFPTLRGIKQLLPESFILFRPKDLVSGDFYFAQKIGTKRVFCTVDCTGHGVPGGFMSIVGHNLLQQAVNQMGLTKPSEILEFLNLGVTNTLHQSYEESSVKDGMDIALCCWDEKTNIVEFAGAFNPLYLFRDGELIEYKGNRFPVGTFVDEKTRLFTNHTIKVEKGDMLYLFSDGFADQFGGPEGKKYKIRRFKAMLQEIHTHSVDEQLRIVQNRLKTWMGSLEQVDDIVILGVRIS